MISKPIIVRPLENYSIWLQYSDGTEGIVNLSYLVQNGIFKVLQDPDIFNKVYIDQVSFAISWSPELEICPDSLYLKLRQITFEQWKESCAAHASN